MEMKSNAGGGSLLRVVLKPSQPEFLFWGTPESLDFAKNVQTAEHLNPSIWVEGGALAVERARSVAEGSSSAK